MKKQTYKILSAVIAALYFCATPAHALIGVNQKWQSNDDVTHRNLAQIKNVLEAKNEMDKQAAGWAQKNTVSSSINHANIVTMHEYNKAEMAAAPDLQKCIAVSSSTSLGSTFAGQQATMNSLREKLAVKQAAMGSTNLLSTINMTGKEELCSPTDVDNGICKKAGTLAGWTDKYDSILQNPVSKHSSLDKKSLEYGADYINSMTYALAPDPRQAGSDGSLHSEQAAALRKVWQQRMSPSVYALNKQLSNSSEIPANSPFLSVWEKDDMRKWFKEIYGENAIRPERPSPRMLEHIYAMKGMVSPSEKTKSEQAPSEIAMLRRIESSLNTTNYFHGQLLEELRILNAQISAMNAQGLSPVSNDNSKYAGAANK